MSKKSTDQKLYVVRRDPVKGQIDQRPRYVAKGMGFTNDFAKAAHLDEATAKKRAKDGDLVIPLDEERARLQPAIEGNAELVTTPKLGKKLQGELSQWETKLRDVGTRINARMEELAYDIVEFGFYLLKVREIYRLSSVERASAGGKAKANKLLLPTLEEADDSGFAGWLKVNAKDVPTSSAYNYMNAALNCGLTHNSTEEAIQKIRTEKALAGKRLGDLYKKPKLLPETSKPADGNQQLELNLVIETLTESCKLCDQLVKLRDEMSPAQYETAVDRLRKTLEDLTGAQWDMISTKEVSNG